MWHTGGQWIARDLCNKCLVCNTSNNLSSTTRASSKGWNERVSSHGPHLSPVNTKHLYNICTMLDQCRRRWDDAVQMLYKCFEFAGSPLNRARLHVVGPYNFSEPSKHNTWFNVWPSQHTVANIKATLVYRVVFAPKTSVDYLYEISVNCTTLNTPSQSKSDISVQS